MRSPYWQSAYWMCLGCARDEKTYDFLQRVRFGSMLRLRVAGGVERDRSRRVYPAVYQARRAEVAGGAGGMRSCRLIPTEPERLKRAGVSQFKL